MRLLALFLAVLTSALAPAGGGALLERARALERQRDWAGVASLLESHARGTELAPEEERVLAGALERLGRVDEAAQRFQAAADGFTQARRDTDAKAAAAAVRRLDPLSARRDPFLRKLAATLMDSVEELLDGGDAERALALAEGLPRIARGKDAERAAQLLQRARAAFEKIRLDADPESAAPGGAAGGSGRALVELDSAHYRLACHLEPDVVKRLGRLMDDVHAYYVRIYFDGDEKRVRGARATIRVLPDKPEMLKHWQGGGSPDGWWSSGSGEVFAYDTRTSSGSLDALMETLFHEASHQFTTLLAGGAWVPSWLNEGTATFFEGAVAMADGSVSWPHAAHKRLAALRQQIGAGKPPRLREVIEYELPGSYAPEYYAWGWGLVYFLLQYEDPATLTHAYRPLYSAYREQVIRRGSGSFATFEKVFLDGRSALHHADFGAFERDFERWILDEAGVLHGRDAKARAKRLARAARLLEAAGAAGRKKSDLEDLLARALVDLEWVRGEIDRDRPDAEVLLQQADVLERLGRASSAAARIEEVLDLAEAGRAQVPAERCTELAQRLARLDRRNAALRTARKRTNDLARAAEGLLADYRASGQVLRSWSLAADLAGVLPEHFASPAAELRNLAREQGLLRGAIRALSGPVSAWSPVIVASALSFEPGVDAIAFSTLRATAFVDQRVQVAGEYELRARVELVAPRGAGWAVGFVVAGAPGRDSLLAGVDDRGYAGLWHAAATTSDTTAFRHTLTLPLAPPLPAGEGFDLAVRMRNDGRVFIRVGDRPHVEARVESGPARNRCAGVFAKNASVRFEGALVELVP